MICQQTGAPKKELRPRHKSIWRGESNSAWYVDFGRYLESYFKKEVKMNHTKHTKQIWILFVKSFPYVVSDLL